MGLGDLLKQVPMAVHHFVSMFMSIMLMLASVSAAEQDPPLDVIGISQKLSKTLKTTKNNKAQSGRGYVPWEDIWNQTGRNR